MKKSPMAKAVLAAALIIVVFFAATLAVKGVGRAELFAKKVGLVELRGVIDQAEPVLKALVRFRYDSDVAAVVLRVDSPGGGVGASQEIYREILKLKKVKPVVCSMGGVAASGGYYAAAACTKIMASPGTVTGSIGVISTIPDARELMNKIGLKLQIVKSGALKAAGQIDRPLDPAERAMIQTAITETHNQFIADVARARRLPLGKVRALADGGIFTGARARELGLVDDMGNLVDALDLAARLGGIKGRPEVVRPRDERGTWWGRLFKDEARGLISEFLGRSFSGGLMYLYRPAAPAP
jgi:protease-4